jgi:hypothetical protein
MKALFHVAAGLDKVFAAQNPNNEDLRYADDRT